MFSLLGNCLVIAIARVSFNVMASKDVDTFNSRVPSMDEAEIHCLMELALKRAGGQGYYVLSGKEDFFKC